MSLRGRQGLAPGVAASPKYAYLHEALGIEPHELHKRLVTTLRSMPQSRDVQALIAAYGFDGESWSGVDDRRTAFGRRFGVNEPSTVKKWENRALPALVEALFAKPEVGDGTFSVWAVVQNGRVASYQEQVLYSPMDSVELFEKSRESRHKDGWRIGNSFIFQVPESSSRFSQVEVRLELIGVPPEHIWVAQGVSLRDVMQGWGGERIEPWIGDPDSGFFTAEAAISYTTSNFRPGDYIGLLWDWDVTEA